LYRKDKDAILKTVYHAHH